MAVINNGNVTTRIPLPKIDIDISASFNSVGRTMGADLSKGLQAWTTNAKRNVSKGAGMKKAHDDTAKGIRKQLNDGYSTRSFKKNSGTYRNQDPGAFRYRRYSGGKLAKALQSPQFIKPSKLGVQFNWSHLDTAAPQWYRLNFGAKPGKKAPFVNFDEMRFFKVPSGAKVTLEGFPQSRRFRIPEGYWSNTRAAKTTGTRLAAPTGGMGRNFYPAALKPKPNKGVFLEDGNFTKGIDGSGYLNKSISYINTQYPRRVERLILDWLELKSINGVSRR